MHLGLRLDGASWTVFETSKRPTAPIATPPLLNAELNSIPCAASRAVKPIHGAPPVIVADSESSPDAVLQPVDGQTFSTLSRSHWHAAYHAATQRHGYCRCGTQRQSLTKQLGRGHVVHSPAHVRGGARICTISASLYAHADPSRRGLRR